MRRLFGKWFASLSITIPIKRLRAIENAESNENCEGQMTAVQA